MNIHLMFAFFLLLAVAAIRADTAIVVLADNTTAARLNADLTIQKLMLAGDMVALGYGRNCAGFHLGNFTKDYSALKRKLDNLSAGEYGDAGSDVAGAWDALRPGFGKKSVWLVAGKDDNCGGLDLAFVKLRGYGVGINVVASEKFTFLSTDASAADGFYGEPGQIRIESTGGTQPGTADTRKCLPFFIIPAFLLIGVFIKRPFAPLRFF